MTRRSLWIAAAAISVLAAGVALFLWQRHRAAERAGESTADAPPAVTGTPAAEEGAFAELYFPSTGGWLKVERRELPVSDTGEERIASLVAALLAGPLDGGLKSPLPGDIAVRKVYLLDGTVFLDLVSPGGRPPPASGSRREMLTVYSLVNTVLLNAAGAERLVLLWNGQQPVTFAGHLSTAGPLVPKTDLVTRQP